MNPTAQTAADLAAHLRQHLRICQEILALVQQEGQHWQQADSPELAATQAKKNLLPKLNQSLDELRKDRLRWQRLAPPDRAQHREVTALLRQSQELIMRIVVLDRENEQTLLRRGLAPARHLPPLNRQRPHFVADLYRQGRGG